MTTHEVKYLGVSHIVIAKAGTGMEVKGHKTLRLSDVSGAFVLTILEGMVPFAKVGEAVLITVSFTKAEIVAPSAIIKPQDVN